MASPDGAADDRPAPIGVYVHVPFCAHKCPYCDFNSSAGRDAVFDAYVAAVGREVAQWSDALASRTIATVFVGGGTPTVLAPHQLDRLLEHVRAGLRVAPDAEVTCEANPGTVDRERFGDLRAAGVNRLSMGAQSLDPAELAWLGRIHDADDVRRAFEAARAAGFEQISLDFMFGLPGQGAATWARTLDGAVGLGPDHISLYSLTVEQGTPLADRIAAGRVPAPDDDEAADRFEEALDHLAAAGYLHYEVSNWARATAGAGAVPRPEAGGSAGPADGVGAGAVAGGERAANGRQPSVPGGEGVAMHVKVAGVAADRSQEAEAPVLACRHNLGYWRNGEYLGLGPGAHSHLRGPGKEPGEVARRWSNVRSIDDYIARVAAGESPIDACEAIDARTSMGETMMLGLRLMREGVPYERFRALHGVDPRSVFGAEIAEVEGAGLVEADDCRVRLTRRGLMLGNQVFACFVGDG